MLSFFKPSKPTWPTTTKYVVNPASIILPTSSHPPQLLFSAWYMLARYNPEFIDKDLPPRAYYITTHATFFITFGHMLAMYLSQKYQGKSYYFLLGILEKAVNLFIFGSYVLWLEKYRSNNPISPDVMWGFLGAVLGTGFVIEVAACLKPIEQRDILKYLLFNQIETATCREVILPNFQYEKLAAFIKEADELSKSQNVSDSFLEELKKSGSILLEFVLAAFQTSVSSALFQWLLTIKIKEINNDDWFAGFILSGAILGVVLKLIEKMTNPFIASLAKMLVEAFNLLFGIFIQITNLVLGSKIIFETNQWTSRSNNNANSPSWLLVIPLIALSTALTARYIWLLKRADSILLNSIAWAKDPQSAPKNYLIKHVSMEAPVSENLVDLTEVPAVEADSSASEGTSEVIGRDESVQITAEESDEPSTDRIKLFYPPESDNCCNWLSGFFGRRQVHPVEDLDISNLEAGGASEIFSPTQAF